MPIFTSDGREFEDGIDLVNTYHQESNPSKEDRTVMQKLTGSDGGERYQTWPEKAIRSLWDTLKLPGDTYLGKSDLNSPAGFSRAMEATLNLVGGGTAFTAAKPSTTLGIFGGRMSSTFPKEKIQKALELLEENPNLSQEDIYKATGLFRGAEGKLRYEIPDTGVKLNMREGVSGNFINKAKLGEVLDHPEFFSAYPAAKDIDVKLVDDARFLGSFNPDTNTLSLNKRLVKEDTALPVILHELQHWVQEAEGFAAGGAPFPQVKFQKEVFELQKEMQQYQKVIDWLIANDPKSAKKIADQGWTSTNPDYSVLLSGPEKERYQYLNKVIETNNKYLKAAYDAAYDNYERLAGEVEANNVMSRRTMSRLEQSITSPLRTEKFPREEQTVFFEPTTMGPRGPISTR